MKHQTTSTTLATRATRKASNYTESPETAVDWVETPQEGKPKAPISYSLLMYDEDLGGQEIDVSRAEFIILKEHLIAIRGYRKDEELKRITADGFKGYCEDYGHGLDQQQTANHLQTARDFYAAFPALVTASDMPSELAELITN